MPNVSNWGTTLSLLYNMYTVYYGLEPHMISETVMMHGKLLGDNSFFPVSKFKISYYVNNLFTFIKH